MCELCRQSPCHPRCPYADEPPVAEVCDDCGADIYVGDEYYHIRGKNYCVNCIEDYKTTAEEYVPEFYNEDFDMKG